ncbi:MAG: hypothetical protein U1F76_29155 [Candidatus Competibacteraceae bacterium]
MDRTGAGRYSLYLKLPQLPDGGDTGELELRSGLGVKVYTASQLQKRRLVPVIPQFPLLDVSTTGNLFVVEAAIRNEVKNFHESGNFFRIGEAGNRLLVPNESLEWGERYWLVTQQVLEPVPEDFKLIIEAEEDWRRDWHVYEITLPTFSKMEDETLKQSLAQYLGRMIRASRPHVYIIDSPAHHIEPDGTYVFPVTTDRIILKKTECDSQIGIEESSQIVTGLVVSNRTDQWAKITVLKPGYFTILLNGHEELLVRIEACDLFQPKGVQVTVGDHTWELFDSDLQETIRHKALGKIQIECPSQRVAEFLALSLKSWERTGLCFSLDGLPNGPVRAENFGTLNCPVQNDEPSFEPAAADAQIRARRAWLEGIVARQYGPDALMYLRQQWGQGSTAGYGEMVARQLTWLRPYIELARSKRRIKPS